MFDITAQGDSTRVKRNNPDERLYPTAEAASVGRAANKLDDDEYTELHGRLMAFWHQEIDRQEENRRQQAIDEDFYDNIQWTEEDAQALKERGQAPLVYNVIAQSINWIIGSEKRGRTDWRVYPRGKEDSRPAELKTKLLKYLSDTNRTPFHRSRAFEDAAKVGIGWLESGLNGDDEGEIVYNRYESWRNMLWDSASTELDLSDARYIFRSKWTDVDVAKAMFPDRQEVIELAAQEGSSIGYDLENGDEVMDQPEVERTSSGISGDHCAHLRSRVRVIECWFKRVVTVRKFAGGSQFAGEQFDPANPEHVAAVQAGDTLRNRPMMRIHLAMLTTAGLLWVSESPYRHNKYPFTPIWCNRRGRDGMPYGFIRNMRDIQEDINKRMSKALAILSSNKVIMDEGAVDDMREFAEEVARPDAIIVKRAGKELVINAERELSAAHLELASRNIQMIQSVSGVTDELLGKSTNAVSGKAVQARQEQGSLTTSKIFDNLRLAVQIDGEKSLSLIEQFFTDQKVFRITNDRGFADYEVVNDGLPENDITRTQADFVVGEADWRVTMRKAQNDQLVEMMTRLPPEVVLTMLDLVIDGMDIANREEIVRRIRQMTGQKDPDADPNAPPTPEEEQAMAMQQEQAAMQQAQMQAQMAATAADTAHKQAQAEKAMAEAQRITVEAQMASAGIEQQAQQLQQRFAEQSMQAEAASQQRMMEMQAKFQQQLAGVQQQAMDAISKYQQQIVELQAEVANKREAAAVELEKARIAAQTEQERARIEAETAQRVAMIEQESSDREGVMQQQLDAVMQQLSGQIADIKTASVDGITKAIASLPAPQVVVQAPAPAEPARPSTKRITLEKGNDGRVTGGTVTEVDD